MDIGVFHFLFFIFIFFPFEMHKMRHLLIDRVWGI